MRSRLCRVCSDFHDVDAPWPHNCTDHFGTRSNGAPNIVPDGLEAFQSHADGVWYDSRSAYYRSLREQGCAIVEPGMFDARRRQQLPPVRETLKQVLQQKFGR